MTRVGGEGGMEIRILKSFLAVASLGNISHAANSLHISQPALSMQIKSLEKELGKHLFVRHARHLELTPEGRLLRERAENIVALADKTVSDFQSMDQLTGGEIQIGAAESRLFRVFAHACVEFKRDLPLTQFDVFSGGTHQVLDRLLDGSLDMALIVEQPAMERFHFLEIPGKDTWGVIVNDDDPLANKQQVYPTDLVGRDLIMSSQSLVEDLPRWAGVLMEKYHYSAFYNLVSNSAHFVREGLGIVLAFDGLISTGSGTGLRFIPFEPPLHNTMYIVWKKKQQFSPIAARFIEYLQQTFQPQ